MSDAHGRNGRNGRRGNNGSGQDARVVPLREGPARRQPRPAPRAASAAGHGEAPPLERVQALAAEGLDWEEIEALLGDPGALAALPDEAIDRALEAGWCTATARVKRAQFAAALEGRVSAQQAVLARLEGGSEPEDGEEELVFRRRIIPEAEAEAPSPEAGPEEAGP